jgi:phosphoribosylanthranilate isomerase
VPHLIVQVYEIQNPEEAEAVVAAGVDHVGSVVASEENWKMPALKAAVGRVHAGGAKSSLIPLFREETPVLRMLEYYQPDLVHFCDALPVDPRAMQICDRLIQLQIRVKKNFPEMSVMRSIPIGPRGQTHRVPTLELGRVFEPFSDFFLTDTLLLGSAASAEATQPVKGFVGITGQTCDWDMAGCLVRQSILPVILAGGVSPENAAEAIAAVRPAGIDSCTLTNARDAHNRPIRFKKDMAKVRALVAAARSVESIC